MKPGSWTSDGKRLRPERGAAGGVRGELTDYREQAAFYRAALLLGLLPGSLVVNWADAAIGRDPEAPPPFVEIASTPATDITALRHALLQLCDDRPSDGVIQALLDLIGRDLASGRRGLRDTMTVLRQVRGFLALTPALNDEIRSLGVDFFFASRDGDIVKFESRLRDWLAPYQSAERKLMARPASSP